MIIDQEKLKDVWTLRSYDHHVHNFNIGRNFVFERKDLRFQPPMPPISGKTQGKKHSIDIEGKIKIYMYNLLTLLIYHFFPYVLPDMGGMGG